MALLHFHLHLINNFAHHTRDAKISCRFPDQRKRNHSQFPLPTVNRIIAKVYVLCFGRIERFGFPSKTHSAPIEAKQMHSAEPNMHGKRCCDCFYNIVPAPLLHLPSTLSSSQSLQCKWSRFRVTKMHNSCNLKQAATTMICWIVLRELEYVERQWEEESLYNYTSCLPTENER